MAHETRAGLQLQLQLVPRRWPVESSAAAAEKESDNKRCGLKAEIGGDDTWENARGQLSSSRVVLIHGGGD